MINNRKYIILLVNFTFFCLIIIMQQNRLSLLKIYFCSTYILIKKNLEVYKKIMNTNPKKFSLI